MADPSKTFAASLVPLCLARYLSSMHIHRGERENGADMRQAKSTGFSRIFRLDE